MILTQNVAEVVEALVKQIQEHDLVVNYPLTVNVTRSERNEDPNECPWLSIYRFGVSFQPRSVTSSAGQRYQNIRLAIACQEMGDSGLECEEKLEKLVQAVTSAILSDPTIRGTVLALGEDFDIQYPDYEVVADRYMQTAVIQFTGINVVGGY